MSNQAPQNKPVIGLTLGDINGIGPELVIRALSDNRINELCTLVVFGSGKVINFYRKTIPDVHLNFTPLRDLSRPNPKQPNILNIWEEDINITPGEITETGGKYAMLSLLEATNSLKKGEIQGMVTAPIHKKNIQSEQFNYSGHTPFLQDFFNTRDVLMLLCADNMRVGLVTEHLAVKDVAAALTKEKIFSKAWLMNESLKKDFGIDKPRIAILALNPHAGDEGLIGREEKEIIAPAIKDLRNKNILAVGPYSPDAFFARHQYEHFDGVLAMYHDQGLIPFKSLAIGEGVNFTAGLPVVRTSPDHGTAFDIAGKNQADHASFLAAIFECVDIWRRRNSYYSMRSNPLKKVTASVLKNAVDESIEEGARR
ncbi:MAG: 4-hydroxythreonine-4-phosphate dehydrogenase PdxA [Dinghuibacter sp.]|nr:4-hydroxythreonine-4-phosphate dehydrogenase PdxA [Dinghuibacter sp.]